MTRRARAEPQQPGITARERAVRVLCQVLGDRRKLSEALERQAGGLADARDRALCKELCFGVLRWLPRLQWLHRQLRDGGRRQDTLVLRCVLYTGLYQIDYLQVPDHAAVCTSVELCRILGQHRAAKLLNALLRRYLGKREAMQQRMVQHETAYLAHPRWWLETFRQAWPDDWQTLIVENNRRAPLYLRVNCLRKSRPAFLDMLARAGLRTSPCQHAPNALRLTEALPVEELPGFAQGQCAVQDGSAQLAAELLPVPAGARMLDACAAPGGKTGLFLERWPDMGGLVAVDRQKHRVAKLIDNLQRLGHLKPGAPASGRNRQLAILQSDLRCPETWWDGRAFDVILLDAPCSGSGIIRRQPDIKNLRRARQLRELINTQQQLLRSCWGLLKPGGRLLYATCSVLPAENGAQIARFSGRQPDCALLPIRAPWGRDTGFGTQLMTGRQGMDGFFYALLRKVPARQAGAKPD